MFNPTLFDTWLSSGESTLQSVAKGHTCHPSSHAPKVCRELPQPFQIGYPPLFNKLKKKVNEARCDLLIKYHSDLFQIESSLLLDGQDGHILIHVPMIPCNMLLRLFYFWLHLFPLQIFNSHHLMLDVKNDVLAISLYSCHQLTYSLANGLTKSSRVTPFGSCSECLMTHALGLFTCRNLDLF
jgi:hypothetical protein